MKKILTLAVFSCFALLTNAATNITTPTVSGTWTLSGSPYKVFNDITINSGSTLTIQPGVEVIFQGYYMITVSGSLQAVGTAASPISFHVNDTTGWSTSGTIGGWNGITLTGSPSLSDSSKFGYCNFSDIKNWIYVFQTDLHIYNSSFFHNRGPLFASLAGSSHVLEMNNCKIYGNRPYANTIVMNGGVQNIHDNEVYNNTGSDVFLIGGGSATIFERNDVHDNVTTQGTIESGDKVVIRKNKIYNNVNYNSPAIHCVGTADIDGNLICNNYHTTGFCGAIDGGGGIQVSSNSSMLDPNTISYVIRNNVIANNYSPFQGGGIRVYDSKTTIVNNQIVNNSSPDGSGLYILVDSFPITVKNNIITGNETTGSSPSQSAIKGISFYSSHFTFEYNYTQSFSTRVFAQMSGFVNSGDTTKNIVGSTPGFTDPTITASHTESALTRNFGLLPASICIDKGDTVGCFLSSVDVAGNPRIYGAAVDMGSYEYRPAVIEQVETVFKTQNVQAYPNPAANILFVSVAEANGMISMVDLSGRQVLETAVDSKTTSLDVSSLARGIYFAIWQHGGKQDIQKVILE